MEKGRFLRSLLAVAMVGHLGAASAMPNGEHGWFWYQNPPPPPKPILLPPPPPPAPAPVQKPKKAKPKPPPVFSVQWIRHALPKYRDEAINDPSTANVTRYLALQKVMFDKAQNFAEKFVQVANTNPTLDYSDIVPRGEAANDTFNSYISQARMQSLRYLSHKVGFWVFVSSSCPFCNMQIEQFQHLVEMDGFKVMYIDTDGGPVAAVPKNAAFVEDEGQAKMLHLMETPSIVMVWPPNNFAIISQGYQVAGSLMNDIVNDAGYLHLLPKSMAKWATSPYDRGVLTTAQMQKAEKEGITTPAQVSKYVQEETAERIQNW
ncbi:conjugal transfer protein TraF [Acidithiobacillus caldus]|uniref:Conjugal transfer protein TraF n=1 Tax=Acidithiobacillus caldus TaxID=33059 RepID=A0A1E7YVB5_9PROT|nr:conjugal transfer protein TraF [Acidithiobacillus caldus]